MRGVRHAARHVAGRGKCVDDGAARGELADLVCPDVLAAARPVLARRLHRARWHPGAEACARVPQLHHELEVVVRVAGGVLECLRHRGHHRHRHSHPTCGSWWWRWWCCSCWWWWWFTCVCTRQPNVAVVVVVFIWVAQRGDGARPSPVCVRRKSKPAGQLRRWRRRPRRQPIHTASSISRALWLLAWFGAVILFT